MMKQKLLALVLLLFVVSATFAQSGSNGPFTIKGQVVDSVANESVPYATLKITLVNTPDQAVKLLACDENGKFETQLKETGTYTVLIQSLGKVPTQKNFTITENNKSLNLGKLSIIDDAKQLDEITVSAQKPLVKVDLDKITYSLEDDPESKTNNVLDMLRKVPMVTVDGDDAIKLKGSTNYKIYMNGKPSNLISNNPSEVLKSMPANSVKDIEVITEPGAKYDAEGIGGIINIITHKNSSLQGVTGSLRASANSNGYYGGGGYLSSKIGKLGLTGQYNYSYSDRPSSKYKSLRENLLSDEMHYLSETGRSKGKGPNQYGYIEASYEIDTLRLLSVGVNLYSGKPKNHGETEAIMTDIGSNPVYSYKRYNKGQSTYGSTNVNVDYQRSTRKKDELITLSYRFSDSPNDSKSYTDIYDVDNYVSLVKYPQEIINDASTQEHTAQLDYTTPIKKGHTVEAGFKYIFRRNQSDTDRRVYDKESDSWENTSSPDSRFEHSQHIYSAYAAYAFRLAKFGFKTGARAEGTALEVDYKNNPEKNFDTDYFDVVPNVTLSYQLGMAKQLRLGYNMRIHRPGIWYLNPYVNDANPEQIYYGNPDLDSEKTNNFNLNFSSFSQKLNINGSLSYSFVNNSIERYTFLDPENPRITHSTYGNIGKRRQGGVYLYGSWNPVPLFNIYVNGGVNYVKLKSEERGMSNDGFNGNIFSGARFNLPKDFRLGINGGYYSPWLQLQGKGSSFYYLGVSADKDFLKKKLTVSINAQNPFFNDRKSKSETIDPTFITQSAYYYKSSTVGINVSYRFGSLKEQIKKVKRGINNDDTQSGGGGEGGSGSGGGGGGQ